MSQLQWGPYGPGGAAGMEARGEHGVWRIAVNEDGKSWWLTFQPSFTRGMLNRGKFFDLDRAKVVAQQHEDDEPQAAAQQIEAT